MRKVTDRIKELLSYAADIGFFHLVSANMLLQIAGAGMTLVLARILSIDDIGRISILQSFYAIFIQIALLGLNTTIIKLCSEKIEETEKEEILITAVKINMIVSLSIVLFVIGTSFLNIYGSSDEEQIVNQVIRVYILQIPFIVLNFLSIAYLQAQSKIKLMSRYQVITRILVIVSVIICSYFWALKGYVAGIVIANIIAFIILLPINIIRPRLMRQYPMRKVVVKKLFDFSKYSLVAGMIYDMMFTIGILLGNYFMPDGKAIIAVYTMGMFFVKSILMIPTSYNQIMIPRISMASHKLDVVWKLYIDMRKKMFLLAIVLFIVGYILVPIAIPILLGAKYSESVKYYRILSVLFLTWSIYSPIGNTLLSIGKVKYNVISNSVTLVVQVILIIILFPQYQFYGVAVAFVISSIVAVIVNQIMLNIVFKGYKS